jgi:hypothetical protein
VRDSEEVFSFCAALRAVVSPACNFWADWWSVKKGHCTGVSNSPTAVPGADPARHDMI